jgi:hypothetical protein
MPLAIDSVLFDILTDDPGSPNEGQMWYNTTSKLYKVYRNSAVTSFTDASTFTGHTGNSSNPHTTTLEQARTAGATLSGAINMGGFSITNVASGASGTDGAQRQWVTDQINQKVHGLDWQQSVLTFTLSTPPGSPVTGDRYIVKATGTGAWAAKDNQIAEWSGTAWVFDVPNEGFCVRIEDINKQYIYDGSAWGTFDATVSHGNLSGLANDDHTMYFRADGTRSMSGSLNLATNTITNAGTINGVSITEHASRHNYGGADVLDTTGTVQAVTDATSAQGSAGGFALVGHTHAHGNRSGGALHALASASGAGFKPQSNTAASTSPTNANDNTQGYAVGSTWINTVNSSCWVATSVATGAAVWKEMTNIAGLLRVKSGIVLAASFAGNPKKSTVTFGTAFPSAAYSVALSCVTGGVQYTPVLESYIAASFVINMGVNGISSLVQVNWTATASGESV